MIPLPSNFKKKTTICKHCGLGRPEERIWMVSIAGTEEPWCDVCRRHRHAHIIELPAVGGVPKASEKAQAFVQSLRTAACDICGAGIRVNTGRGARQRLCLPCKEEKRRIYQKEYNRRYFARKKATSNNGTR